MSETQSRWQQEIDSLRTLRDELRVKLNLAGKEARDLFEAAEKSWRHVEARARQIERESRKEAEGVGAAGQDFLAEIRNAYKRIRELL